MVQPTSNSKPTYISNSGTVIQHERSRWRLSYVPELIWGIFNQITFFFSTLIGGSSEPQPRGANRNPSSRRPPGNRIGGFDSGGNVTGGRSVSGSGPSKGPDNGQNNRRGDMKNILSCNAASGS